MQSCQGSGWSMDGKINLGKKTREREDEDFAAVLQSKRVI